MTEREKKLKEERETLYQLYKAKDRELEAYRKSEESRITEELNQKYKNKIIRERLIDRGLSVGDDRERSEDYRLIAVEKVNFKGNGFIQFSGSVIEMFVEETYVGITKHFLNDDVWEAHTSFYHCSQLNIDEDKIDGPYEIDDPRIEEWMSSFDGTLSVIRDRFITATERMGQHS